jgi:hypothetical protein
MGKYGSSYLYWNDPNYPEWGNSDHFNFLSTILTNTFFSTSFSEIFSQFDRTRFDLHVLQKLLLFNERRLRKNKNNIVFVNFEGEGVGDSSFRFISFSTVLPFDICIVLVFDTWIFDIFISAFLLSTLVGRIPSKTSRRRYLEILTLRQLLLYSSRSIRAVRFINFR